MRLNKNLLPQVYPSHAAKGWGMDTLESHYAALPKRLLRVSAYMATPVILSQDESVHLDALISTAVLNIHPCSLKFDNDSSVPTPLHILWQDEQGYPLWAATDLKAIGDTTIGREYWHKRYPADKAEFAKKRNANTTAGRNREYRVPVQTVVCTKMEAACIGNQAEIERLLSEEITHIGKKGTQGFGRVGKWVVEPMYDPEPEMLIANNRTIPLEYAREKGIIGCRVRAGWHTPYWYAPHWRECITP